MQPVLIAVALAAGLVTASAQETSVALLPIWNEADVACRDGVPGLVETRAACARRDHFTHRLSRLGQCYGRQGQPLADRAWHACELGSNRLER